MSKHNNSRRDFLKKTAYVAPVVLTLQATPALAGQGSALKLKCNNGFGDGGDGCTPGSGAGARSGQDD